MLSVTGVLVVGLPSQGGAAAFASRMQSFFSVLDRFSVGMGIPCGYSAELEKWLA